MRSEVHFTHHLILQIPIGLSIRPPGRDEYWRYALCTTVTLAEDTQCSAQWNDLFILYITPVIKKNPQNSLFIRLFIMQNNNGITTK